MGEQLRLAMLALADDANDMSPPTGAWQSGQRMRRRSTLLAVSAAVVVTVLVTSLVWIGLGVRSTSGIVAGRLTIDPSLPERIWAPSPWLHGTDDDGPLGPLALIGVAERHTSWLHEEPAVFGVSAHTGEYRYLDLPSLSGEGGAVETGMTMSNGAEVPPRVALSPDGTKVAYLYDGTPTVDEPLSNVVGFAVYDTVTGDVDRYPVGAARGLELAGVYGPLWSTDGRYLWVRAQVDGEGIYPSTSFVLDVGGDRLRATKPQINIGLNDQTYGPWLQLGGSATLYPQLLEQGVPKYTQFGTFRASPDGSIVALGYGKELYTAPTPSRPRGQSDTTRIANDITVRAGYGVLGWSDDAHIVVALSNEADKIPLQTQGFAQVDATTGAVTSYVEGDAMAMDTEPQLATDFIATNLVDAEEPPKPDDPRLRIVLPVAAIVLVLGAVVLARRRNIRRVKALAHESD